MPRNRLNNLGRPESGLKIPECFCRSAFAPMPWPLLVIGPVIGDSRLSSGISLWFVVQFRGCATKLESGRRRSFVASCHEIPAGGPGAALRIYAHDPQRNLAVSGVVPPST